MKNTHSRRCPSTLSLPPSSWVHRPPCKLHWSKNCFTASYSLRHFWWLLLLCCPNCSSASANNLELPKALRHSYDHGLCHLMQHTTLPQHLFPWAALHPPACSSSAWHQGTHCHRPAALPSPSTDHHNHYLPTDLLRHSSSAKTGTDHSAGDPLSFRQWFSHQTIFLFSNRS